LSNPNQLQNLLLSNISGFHIEPTNICTLKCAGCARTRFIKQWPQHWKNHSINVADLMTFLDCDLEGKYILLSGNYGDPIYHPEFHSLVRNLKERGCCVEIITNGSYRSPEWWQQLTAVLDCNDTVTFSVDGLPENFTQYRVNADWQSIEQAMKICAESSARTVWKYIPFSYNINDIDLAKRLSESMNIDQFRLEKSDRFDELTDQYKPGMEFLGERYDQQQDWKHNKSHVRPNPKCADGKQHFISAEGHYAPCCWAQDHRFYYKTQFGKNKSTYKIADTTLSQLLDQPTTIEFYNNLSQQPVCQYNCPGTS
jgi:wyosine [tRNA(Phe)-imidazoG37] synthetase (radical SAM superfamily)